MEYLRPYYERELEFIRQMGGEFATVYPKIAGRLQLEKNRCEDPHVERLLEGFALLAGRIQHKLDDELSEFTESLLDVLYPHFLRPIPSMAIVQFAPKEGQSKPDRTYVPANTYLHSRPAEGTVCTFRTCYPVEIWPIQTAEVSVTSANTAGLSGSADISAVIRVVLETRPGVTFGQLPLSNLTFRLGGEVSAAGLIYELLFANLARIVIRGERGSQDALVLQPSSLRPLGLTEAEAVLPYSGRSFSGYRLLQEYFSFPDKFLFAELGGLERLSAINFGTSCEILFCIGAVERPERRARLEQAIGVDSFQLGCTPVVNLFERDAEPIRLSHTRYEYRVVPDQHRQSTTEVHSVNQVASTAPYGEQAEVYQPLYGTRYDAHASPDNRFWFTRRRPSPRKGDSGTDVYLSLVDLDLKPSLPPSEILSARVTCTNRDRAGILPWSTNWGEVAAENQPLVRTRFVRKPTSTVRPPLSGGLHWRLISHLAINHLSIVSGGLAALQEILRLYDFSAGEETLSIEKQISGIVDLRSRQSVSRVAFDAGVAFCRGLDVEIEFDEEQYAGAGLFLFASVLEKFLGLYSAINSFSRLTARTRQRKEVLKRWTALAGEQRIL